MPTFLFRARDRGGRPREGERPAPDASALSADLRAEGLLVLEIRSRPERTSGRPFSLRGRLPATSLDVELGLVQIAAMLRSGLTLLSALKTAAEQARRPAMGAVWSKVAERILEGASFAAALAEHPRRFPEFLVQAVRVGEQTGALEGVLARCADHLERRRGLRATLASALLYPSIVLALALFLAGFMAGSVIPKLERLLTGLGRRLPPLTQALLDAVHWMNAYYPVVAALPAAILVGVVLLYGTRRGRLILDSLALRLPLAGRLLRLSGTASFARGMSLLLESGVTQLEALRTAEGLLQNRRLAAEVGRAREAVLRGATLSAPLAEGGFFMPMLPRMAAVGEATGTLDRALGEVARFHEGLLAAAIRRMLILLEPAIIAVVGGIVGFVYIAFFVALFSLAGR